MSHQVRYKIPKSLLQLTEPAPYKVAYGGRGGCKSFTFSDVLLIDYVLPYGLRVLCTREVQDSIRESVHRLLAERIQALGIGDAFQVIQTEIRCRKGGGFIFAGLSNLTAESIKSMTQIDICWVEEGQAVRQRSWDILLPTLREDPKPGLTKGSELWVSMNPNLDTDDSYTRWIKNPPDSAIVMETNWRDNPWLPETLERQRKEFLLSVERGTRSKEDYDHIWNGKPRGSVSGAIYSKDLARIAARKGITTVPWNPSHLVYASFDLGKRDATAIWFWQQFAGEVNFISYFEDSGEELTYYMQHLESTGYKFKTIYLPHDAKQDRLGQDKTVEQLFLDNGYPVEVQPVLSLNVGIDASRRLMARAKFDEKGCAAGLEALRHYKWGYNNAMDELKPVPVHDWASHGADAFRGAGVSFQEVKPRKKLKVIEYGGSVV